jgi:hypothetical protein
MKKIYLSILSVALISGLNAQIKQTNGPKVRSNDRTEMKPKNPVANSEKAVSIWESTFGDATEWILDHDATACDLDWQIGTNSCAGFYPLGDIVSTTASDGWALLDSDNYGGETGGVEVEDSWLTMANPVDLSSTPNVVVEYETYYRSFNAEKCYVVVGFGDGTGPGSVVWPDLDPTTDISAMSNVFAPYDFASGDASDNPSVTQINISPALVGASATDLANVYIRLNWTGTWGYAWFVDDFKIIEQPANDIQMLSAYIMGENNSGLEYGRNPINQMDVNWQVGASVFNFGSADATNVKMLADFGGFISTTIDPLLENDSTRVYENIESPALSAGVYTGYYTAVCDEEQGGASFGNNALERTFAVTDSPNMLYSTDGIDVYPAADAVLGSIGTDSFTDGEDGLVMTSLYHIKNATEVSGIQVVLAAGTVAGAEVYGSIMDTALFWSGNMSPLYAALPGIVTQADITAGFMNVYFDGPINLPVGIYYAAIDCYSNFNSADIVVYDDQTVAQPADASAIYIAGAATPGPYTNGDALGIRLLMGSDWGAGIEVNALEGVSVYPNPSQGIVNISNNNNASNAIVVYDMLGQVILTKEANTATTLDLSENGTGVYLVEVSNNDGSMVERVVIK